MAVPDVLNHEDLALNARAMLPDQPDGDGTFSTCRGQWKAASAAAVTRGKRTCPGRKTRGITAAINILKGKEGTLLWEQSPRRR